VSIEIDGKTYAVLRQRVSYDAPHRFVDTHVTLGDDPTTDEVEKLPPLRFMYAGDRLLIQNPSFEAKCGTSWIELPRNRLRREFGYGFDVEDQFPVEPVWILRNRRGKPRIVENNASQTVYEVPVVGSAGASLSFLVKRPDLERRLEKESVVARVVVRRDRGPIDISVDVAQLAERVTGESAEGVEADVTWTLERRVPRIDRTLPTIVAQPSCAS
jgi:hypothetical protein